MLREHGDGAVEVLARILVQADIASGGSGDPKVCELWAGLLISKFEHRSLEAFVLAIRNGLTGKVFGRLNVTQIGEWLEAYEAQTLGQAESEYAAHKFTGDNLGGDYLDRLQHEAGAKDRKLQQQGNLIEQLRRKLDAKP